ncbi:XRE family transcriptional regulator [Streptomyces sp. RS10V-4]|uniref:helix-turn-helix domain-containing protein n=1 Tax=Streptomyces rhizoryzae TaxID=2932493 RepID=UPI002006B91B|nr:XRE family transcriptional regulator [Streptomyces rhizoryzae]MCK7621737.1 XRE family transcriptional regulator [Streptomyces rhizoryzae]
MTDWKPLPHTLDADVRNLIDQLRACKDRSGLSLASLAERTLHSKSSWERYLNGKAFPPQEAVTSLGRQVGADAARLAALWELADRAWSGRHVSEPPSAAPPAAPDQPTQTPASPDPTASPHPAGSSPTGAPPHPPGSLAPPSPPQPPGSAAGPPPRRRRPRLPAMTRLRPRAARRAVLVGTAAALAALIVSVVVIRWEPASHASPGTAARPATTTGTESKALETHCFQESCRGADPKTSGCAGDAWTAALTRVHDVYLELRYSDSCKAAWARISWGTPGDIAKVMADNGASYQEHVRYDTDVYSPMVAAEASSQARACAIVRSGARGCTGPGGSVHLTEPPEPPTPAAPATGS